MSLQHDESLETWVTPLCRLITDRTGIVIHDHQVSGLRDTVKKACQQFGYKDPNGFYNALFKDNGLSPEIGLSNIYSVNSDLSHLAIDD